MNIELKKVNIEDIFDLQKVSKQSFIEAFSEDNSPEDMEKYIAHNFSIEKLTGEVSNPESEFYLAFAGSNAIGYFKLNYGNTQTEIKDKDSVEIERIYVLKDYTGMKVGQFLFDKILEIAKASSHKYIWLGVWEKNLRAIHFYKKNGFVEFDKHIFQLGSDSQTDIMMKRYIE